MKQKATALTATTVAVTSLLPSINQVDSRTVAAQQLPTQHIQHIKSDSEILYSDNKIDTSNKTNSLKKQNRSLTHSTEQKNHYIVNANVLNIRSKPTINSSIIDRLPNGAFISVQETTGDWYKISYNEQVGYAKKEFVSHISEPLVKGITTQKEPSFYVATPTLKVRSGAGTNTAVIGSLQNGAQIKIVETVGTWYKIRFGTTYGFVAKHYIIQKQPQTRQTAPSIPAVFKFPTKGTLSSTFDVRWEQMHYGIDLTAPGNVPIHAAAAGKVIKSYYSASYGNVVFIAHHIKGKLYTTVYAHMKDRSVQVEDSVQTGDLLGYMGNTGHSFGQHLHFELHNGEWNFEKTNAVNPLSYLVR